MYNILPETKGHIIVIRIKESLTSQDHKTLLPYLKKRTEENGKIRLLIELQDFEGVEFLGLLKMLSYLLKHGKHIEKKAIITDEEWISRWTSLLSPLSKAKIRCFSTTKDEEAREWVRE